MRYLLCLSLFLLITGCHVANSKWDDGSRKIEETARVFRLDSDSEEAEEIVEDSKPEHPDENRRRQRTFQSHQDWADEVR